VSDDQLEPAARRLCEIRGLDPDGTVVESRGGPRDLVLRTYRIPAWRTLVPEIGDINPLRGVCDCCPAFRHDTIITHYRVLIERPGNDVR